MRNCLPMRAGSHKPQATAGSESERAVYDAQRSQELELDKAAAAFEHAIASPLFLLNGGAVVAFLALLGNAAKKESGLGIEISVAVLAMVVWAVALAAAGAGVRAGHESQQWFSRAVRARRQLMEHRLLGSESSWISEEVVQGKPDPAAPGRFRDAAVASQNEWLALTWYSLVGFILGAFFAAAAVTTPVLFAAGPLRDPWDLGGPYNQRTLVTGGIAVVVTLVILVTAVVKGVRLARGRRGPTTAKSTGTIINRWVKRLLKHEDVAAASAKDVTWFADFAEDVTWFAADGRKVVGTGQIRPEIEKLHKTLNGARGGRVVVDAAGAFVEFAGRAEAAGRERIGVAFDVRDDKITAVRCYGPVREVANPSP